MLCNKIKEFCKIRNLVQNKIYYLNIHNRNCQFLLSCIIAHEDVFSKIQGLYNLTLKEPYIQYLRPP